MKKIKTFLVGAAVALSALAAPAIARTAHVVDFYDGDTFYINMDGLPPELRRIGVRVRDVDTPEKRGKCQSERTRAIAASRFTQRTIESAGNRVTLTNVRWDKYGGRVNADVHVGGRSLSQLLINNGHGVPYNGGKRRTWC